MLDRDERLALLPLEDDEADALLARVPGEARDECWWLVLRDGTAVAGDHGGGVLVLTELRLTHPLGRLLERIGASRLVDAFDKRIARHRAGLSRLVPDGPQPRRYP